MPKKLLLIVVIGLMLAACGGSPSGSSGAGDPAKMVEKYLQAKITNDEKGVRSMICAAMEKDAQQEATTFLGTDGVELQAPACTFDGTSKVTCTGKIVAKYGQEKNEFPLVSYKVVQEAGEWKYCGETQ
ncbi:MAG: hypothetical protein U0559_06410 [Anaerolineae bacterium]